MGADLLSLFGKPASAVLDQDMLPELFLRYLDLTTAYTDARPGLLLTAWLPFCAVNLGNRVYMVNNSTRIYPNIWSCVVGPSSVSRKTTALRFAGYTVLPHERDLQSGPLGEYEQNTMLLTGTTLSKLMSYLALNPNRLFVHNEISAWLHEMNKSYNAGYKQVVTEIYDNVDRTVANRERTERIIRPALSIAAASTEGWLFRNLMDGADQLSGFLQRMIFFVLRKVEEEELDLSTRSGEELEEKLGQFDTRWFARWRAISGLHRLDLAPETIAYRNEMYEEEYRKYFRQNNDTLLSYFTRIFDGYWFKFCTIIRLSQIPGEELDRALSNDSYGRLFADWPVDTETAAMAWYLCRFYMQNTLPLLEIMDEKDKLSGERKIVEILINRFGGKAKHSELMNTCHMNKREFKDSVETLIDREAVKVESYGSGSHVGRCYVLDRGIMSDWSK